jgi:hypothetical protein
VPGRARLRASNGPAFAGVGAYAAPNPMRFWERVTSLA